MNYRNIVLSKIKAPSFMIKLGLISVLFLLAINIEMGVVKGYSISLIGENQVNVTLFIMHIFSYFEMYSQYFLIGIIILIPDILDEPYLTTHIYLKNEDRGKLFKNTISLIATYLLFFIVWFIVLTIIFSLFRLKIFNFAWPNELMDSVFNHAEGKSMALISVPYSATKYPFMISFLLILFRVFLGFFIIALASFYISFKKKNVSYGVGLAVILYVISDLLFRCGNTRWDIFNDPQKMFSLGTLAYKYSMCTFFTFENVGVDFMPRIIHSYILGTIVIAILLILIKKEINKSDLC